MKTSRRLSGDDTPVTRAADGVHRATNPALDRIPQDADPLTVQILTLIYLNPGAVPVQTDVDAIAKMTPANKQLFLADLRKALGIKPVGRVIKS
jgi:hypothetical protein